MDLVGFKNVHQQYVTTVVEWRNCGGNPIIFPSQSITRDSSSVQAGDDAHLGGMVLWHSIIITIVITIIIIIFLRESKTVDAIREHVPQEGGVGVEGREVGVHVGGLPVGHPWHDHLKRSTSYQGALIIKIFYEMWHYTLWFSSCFFMIIICSSFDMSLQWQVEGNGKNLSLFS